MPTEETLIAVLLIALAANLGLMVLVIVAAWFRRRRRRFDDSAPILVTPAALDAARAAARASAAAISSPSVATDPAPATAAGSRPVAASSGAPPTAVSPTGRVQPDAGEPTVPPGDMAPFEDEDMGPLQPADGATDRTAAYEAAWLVDPRTGLDSPRAWSRSLSEEMARIARYRRPASIVLVEVEGLERLIDRFGVDAADRLLPVISDILRKNARAADHVASLERGRYGILLTETDEIRAINFIERIRTSCDAWLAAGAVTLRLAIGWADANAGRTIDDAVATAEDRLNADRRRPHQDAGARAGSPENGPPGD